MCRQMIEKEKSGRIRYYSILAFIGMFILSFYQHALSGQLTGVKAIPGISSVAGEYTDYILEFKTSVTGNAGAGVVGLPLDGKIKIDFPVGFDCDYAIIGTFLDTLDQQGGLKPEWYQDQTVVIRRDGTGAAIAGDSLVILRFGNVLNTGAAGNYTVSIQTRQGSTIIDEGTASFDISPSAFHHFGISGIPASVTAGQSFGAGSVTVSARDAADNLVTNFTGEIYFTSSDGDPRIELPFTSSSKYRFTAGDGGTHDFSKSGFKLITKGERSISVVNDSLGRTDTSDKITVAAGLISNFAFVALASQTAGVAFDLSVINAVDSMSNAASGVVVISDSVNAIDSPNGMSPSFSNITVSNGSGSARQTLVKDTTSVRLKGVVNGITRGTSTFDVGHGSIGSVKILEEKTGSTPVFGDSTISIGGTADMHTVSYDHYGNYRGNEIAEWSVSGGIGSVGSTAPFTTFTAENSGAGKVIATVSGSFIDETGVIFVPDSTMVGALDHIKIRTAPNGQGRSLSFQDTTITTDDVLTLYAAGYDNSNNFIEDLTVKWKSYGDLQPEINDTTTAVLRFNPTTVTTDAGFISAKYAKAINDTIADFTSFIHVVAGAVNHIIIKDGWQAGSNPIDMITMNAGDSKKMYAIGYDADNNLVRPIWAKWSYGTIDSSIAILSPDSSTNTTFYPKKTGLRTVTADSQGIVGGSARITVEPGAAHHIKITTEPIIYPNQPLSQIFDTTYVTTDTTLRLYAAAFDTFDNFIINAEPNWSISGSLDPVPTQRSAYVNFNPITAGTEGRIHALPPSFAGDSTGYIIIKAGRINQLQVALGGQGDTRVLGDTTLAIGDTLYLHAAGYDADGNYSDDEHGIWAAYGNIGEITTLGDSVFFRAARSGQGYIQVSKTGLRSGASGTITVQPGNIDHVVIRSQPNGEGTEIGNKTITTDEILDLYAASYDEADNYLGPVSVDWSLLGDLVALNAPESDTMFQFIATRAPRTGSIKIEFSGGETDETGTITVQPGVAFGNISLTANPPGIPADGVSRTIITSDTLQDQYGNQVRENTLVTVRTTIGTIDTTDLSPTIPDKQVAVNADGIISFPLKADTGGGTAHVTANSGNAQGFVQVAISNVKLISIVVDKNRVSRGQENIPVTMTVQNLSEDEITIVSAGLRFTGSGSVSRNGDYDYTPPGSYPAIPGGQVSSWNMLVDVHNTATLDTITINGFITTNVPNVADYSASYLAGWRVQKPAAIEIAKVEAIETQVAQGERNVDVSIKIRNTSGSQGATFNIASIYPTFWDGATNVTDDYVSALYGSNPTALAGGDSAILNFKVNVNVGARERPSILLNGYVEGYDINSGLVYKDSTADTTDTWAVLKAARVMISSFKPSHLTVTQGQTSSWYAVLVIQNNGYNPVKLDSLDLQLFKLNKNITSEYTIVKPDSFEGTGINVLDYQTEDSLKIEITKTGTTTDVVQLRGYVKLSDLVGGGDTIEDEAWTNIVVQKPSQVDITAIKFSRRQVTRNQSQPWQVKLAMSNRGGSDIIIDTTRSQSYISFSTGSDFKVDLPYFKSDMSTELGFGQQDTLIFNVTQTGDTPGTCKLTIHIKGTEKNSGESFQLVETDSVLIQAIPSITIHSVTNEAPNPDGYVNRKQRFTIKTVLENTGGLNADEVDEIHLRLISNLRPEYVLHKIANGVSPLKNEDVYFDVVAADTFGVYEQYSVIIDSARSDNTREVVTIDPSGHYKAGATVVNPSKLIFLGYELPERVKARQYRSWKIEITLADTTGADIIFNKPQSDDIVFMQDDNELPGYQVLPPDSLQGGGLVLGSGMTDKLIYTVTTTGDAYGDVQVVANLSAVDENDPELKYTPSLTGTVFVESSANLTLEDAVPFCKYVDAGEGQVNVNQFFTIGAIIQNEGAERADSIHLRLSTKYISDTSYVDFENLKILEYIDITSRDTAYFEITPQKVKAEPIEFIVQLLKATGHKSRLPVALDQTEKTVYMRIHQPASLQLSLATKGNTNIFAVQQDFQVQSVVNKLGTSLVDNSGKIELAVPDGYQIITESGETNADTTNFALVENTSQQLWTVRAPINASGPDSIMVHFVNVPRDEFSGQVANVFNQSSKIPVYTKRTILTTNSSISEPAGATDGTVSTSQWFQIRSDITFSENLAGKRVELKLPDIDRENNYIKTKESPIIDSTNVGTWHCIWNVFAPETRQDAAYFKIVATGYEKDNNIVTNQDSFRVTTVERAKLILDAYISKPEGLDPDQTAILSTGQTFEITAKVENKGQAQVSDERAYLYLDVSGTNTTLIGNSRKPFVVGSKITWQLEAPVTETTLDYIIVRIDSIPIDLNRGLSAEIVGDDGDIKKLGIRTVDIGSVSIDTVRISKPTGATDGVISTEQEFYVEAEISWNQIELTSTSYLPKAEIFLPSAFASDSKIKQFNTQGTISWRVTASSVPDTGAAIAVAVTAYDDNDNSIVLTDGAPLPYRVKVVGAAEVRLQAAIISPASATDGVVSTGQQFTIEAYLENDGEAPIRGTYGVSINLPSGYGTTTSITQTKDASQKAVWTVTAPNDASQKKEITVNLNEPLPLDVNTDLEVNAKQLTDRISIITEQKSVQVSVLKSNVPRSLAKGSTVIPFFGLIFQNSGDESSNQLLLKALRLQMKNRKGEIIANPSQTVSKMSVVKASNFNLKYCELTSIPKQNPINLVFSRIDTIHPLIPDTIQVLIDIGPDASTLDFMFSLDTTSAITIVDMYTNKTPVFKNASGTTLTKLDMNSGFSVIMEADLNKAFCNYPNPFGNSSAPSTKIVYYLKNDTDVEIRIFSLIGELVYFQNFTRYHPEGKAGMHDENYFGTGGPPIYWNAVNNHGHKVLNGVYIAVLSTADGEVATTKIAVIK
ncbi:hypothetical protein JXJ21_24470 [candidate division KSB1 bacterium]|nr:hypothetical protein [candidate division KSB1 bacterium]